MIIGITGGIASGKSTLKAIIAKMGYEVLDADQVARNVIMKGNAAYSRIIEVFGTEIVDDDGQIDRRQLASVIFQNEEMRIRLNDITHPIIMEEIMFQALEIENSKGMVFLDIPLLFETGYDLVMDYVIVCYVPEDIQMQRLMQRDQIDAVYAAQKIDAQWSLEKKVKLADFVIDNSGTVTDTEAQVQVVIDKLLKGRRE